MTWLEVFVQSLLIVVVLAVWGEFRERQRFEKLKGDLTEALWARIEKKIDQ